MLKKKKNHFVILNENKKSQVKIISDANTVQVKVGGKLKIHMAPKYCLADHFVVTKVRQEEQ